MLYKTERIFPLIESVILNRQEGQVYKLNTDCELIIHKATFGAIKGKFDVAKLLDFFANEESLPQYFHIYDADESLIDAVLKDERFGTKVRKRFQLRFEEKLQTEIRKTNQLISYKEVKGENFEDTLVFDGNSPDKFWRSKDDFLENGVGVILYDEAKKPAAICYSACVANTIAEIDIYTLPEKRGKGYAKIITKEFIEVAIRKGIIPNWDCFEENIASLKTAKKLNFKLKFEYTFLSIFRN